MRAVPQDLAARAGTSGLGDAVPVLVADGALGAVLRDAMRAVPQDLAARALVAVGVGVAVGVAPVVVVRVGVAAILVAVRAAPHGEHENADHHEETGNGLLAHRNLRGFGGTRPPCPVKLNSVISQAEVLSPYRNLDFIEGKKGWLYVRTTITKIKKLFS